MEFRILGPLEVVDKDGPVPLAGAKQRALLAMLVLHANQVVSSDQLLDELWGDRPPESGAGALQVRISQLRKALGPGGRLLETRAPGYLLRLDPEQFDLQRFERLVDEAESVEPRVAADKLREALGLWRGSALADLSYEGFAQTAIARLEELRVAALERRVEADLALGRHSQLVSELEALVAEHPLRERLRGQLMLALYRSGRQGEALEAYRAARQTLVDELGIEPSPALQELERTILRQDPSLDLEQPPGPQRSILVVSTDEERLDHLLALAEPLARRPPREVILARIVSAEALGRAAAHLNEVRESLASGGVAARSAVFTSTRPGEDAVRLAGEQDVDLVLVPAVPALLDDPDLGELLRAAPCDVGVVVGRPAAPGSVLVPFAGAEHDWSAISSGPGSPAAGESRFDSQAPQSRAAGTRAVCSRARPSPSSGPWASPRSRCSSTRAPSRSPQRRGRPQSQSSGSPIAGARRALARPAERSPAAGGRRCSCVRDFARAASPRPRTSPASPGRSGPADHRAHGGGFVFLQAGDVRLGGGSPGLK